MFFPPTLSQALFSMCQFHILLKHTLTSSGLHSASKSSWNISVLLQRRKMRSTRIPGGLSIFVSSLSTVFHAMCFPSSPFLCSLISRCNMIFLSASGTHVIPTMKASCYLLKKLVIAIGAIGTTRKWGWKIHPEILVFMAT